MKSGQYFVLCCVMVVFAFTFGCDQSIDGYIAASSISRGGFARNRNEMLKLHGTEIKIWGYVDYGNVYCRGVKADVPEKWTFDHGTRPGMWRFNLKARPNDILGQSFSVHIPRDSRLDQLFATFAANESKEMPTKVFIRGKIFTFDAPGNFRLSTGLSMEVASPDDVTLDPSDHR